MMVVAAAALQERPWALEPVVVVAPAVMAAVADEMLVRVRVVDRKMWER